MLLSVEEIYKELADLEEKDFDSLASSAKTDEERNFWMQVKVFFYGEKNPKTIYHYTNFSALEGILSGDGLRMFRSDNMNDKAEMHNFIDILEKSVKKRIDQKDMKSVISLRFNEERIKRRQEIAYLASFSTWKDDVSQWERYGNGGYGVVIAFDFKNLHTIASNAGLRLQKVFYGTNADKHQIVDVLEDLFLDKDHVRHAFLQNDWDAVFDSAWGVSVAHKHYSFASEQEFRLVTLPTWKGKRHDKLGSANIVCTPSAIKECVHFDWKNECNKNNIPIEKIITGIIIGPRSGVTKRKLQERLKEMGMECMVNNVSKSKSTLR